MVTVHNPAPIVLFVYNRPWHTIQTVETLQKNELASESDLFIFADGPKPDVSKECLASIEEVRQYIHTIKGFKSITYEEATKNKGLADSVIYGVNKIINKFGKVIVVEDDIITHPFFLRFMNEALDFYMEDERIFCIGAFMENINIPNNYSSDIFVSKRIETWGWATWLNKWEQAEWDISKYSIITNPTKKEIRNLCKGGEDLWPLLKLQAEGKIDSWAARWQYNVTKHNGLCLRPVNSLVSNIGNDGSGTHCGDTTISHKEKENISIWDDSGISSTPIYNRTEYKINMCMGIREDARLITNLQNHFRQVPQPNTYWRRFKLMLKKRLDHASTFLKK